MLLPARLWYFGVPERKELPARIYEIMESQPFINRNTTHIAN